MALLIFVAFPLGLYMHDLPLSPYKLRLFNYHKWIGATMFMLIVPRLVLRLVHNAPDLSDSTSKWERLAASSMHYFLYALIFAVPLTGWVMSSAQGFQTVLFGVIPLPDLVGKDKMLGKLLKDLHQDYSYLMLALVAGHIAAALKHYFITRDDILARMIPFLRKSNREVSDAFIQP